MTDGLPYISGTCRAFLFTTLDVLFLCEAPGAHLVECRYGERLIIITINIVIIIIIIIIIIIMYKHVCAF